MANRAAAEQPPRVSLDSERTRLARAREDGVRWDLWGPYLAERQWGTVREDYSRDGQAWHAVPHDHARSRAYRWGEDGLLGISDDQARLCFALALWNGKDPILKERLFGLTGPEGNHGEDVKEAYYYLDATPTHSYLKGRYNYPQQAFPYAELVAENRRRGRDQPEYELFDTGVFTEDRYFDIIVEYAKAAPTISSSACGRRIVVPRQRFSTYCRLSGSAMSGLGTSAVIGHSRCSVPLPPLTCRIG